MASNSLSGRFYTGGFPPICHAPPEPLERHDVFPELWLHAWASYHGETFPGSAPFHAAGPITLTYDLPNNRWQGRFRNPANPAHQINLMLFPIAGTPNYYFALAALRDGAQENFWISTHRPAAYDDPWRFGPDDRHDIFPPVFDSAADVFL